VTNLQDARRVAVQGRNRMTPSEALVETDGRAGRDRRVRDRRLGLHDALDLFPPPASASFPPCTNRAPRHGGRLCARQRPTRRVHRQNGPGITNFVTAIAAAYWAHSPVVAITPETGSMTLGWAAPGNRAARDLLEITKFQAHLNNPKRMAELAARAFDRAVLEMGPVQLNIPRDYFYGELECEIAAPIRIERGPGGSSSLDEAARLLAGARFPVILCVAAS